MRLNSIALTLIAVSLWAASADAGENRRARIEQSEVKAEEAMRAGLYVSPLGGVDAVRLNLASLLALRVWRTLKRPTAADGPEAVRSATVYWPSSDLTVVSTPEQAQAEGFGFVLWGSAQHYGDGYVLDTYLTATSALTWSIQLGLSHGDMAIDGAPIWVSLGIPREVFPLGTASLPQVLVDQYQTPSMLRVCVRKVTYCSGPVVGEGMTAQQHEPTWSLVKTNDGVTGWIYLPGLSTASDVMETFPGALLAYSRGEFRYAASLFEKVAGDDEAPSELRADARALAVCALSRVDPEQAAVKADALAASPSSAYDVEVAVMNHLAIAGRLPEGAARTAAVAQAQALLQRRPDLFEADDPWLRTVRDAIGPPTAAREPR